MKIPKKIKVGGHTIDIVFKELEGLDGRFDTENNTLSICSKIKKSQQEATFFHELFHAINSEWGNTRDGHIILESIAQQLYQVLSDNHMLK